jgi:hypothetical protein
VNVSHSLQPEWIVVILSFKKYKYSTSKYNIYFFSINLYLIKVLVLPEIRHHRGKIFAAESYRRDQDTENSPKSIVNLMRDSS